ncbi:hypothetical protein KFE96_06815 [Kordiimonas sp. SCSIO 12603]|uniref:hypothetical protein n=1 Tax=Kordiimonas sp. SCSIO 12603 TaxID=2829596 RepID=UPI00210295E1|nr:hypothetical protein [Kordiimonas sp. SCSIO 12603]UTW60013.1 hypothetical protein KFE96_06815 [Kordiimonas sp. SCSIO 12603]
MNAPSADELILHFRYFSWLYLFYSYDETHLLIADPFFIRKVMSAQNRQMRYNLATPETYEQHVTEDIKKILVFCSKDELPLIKKLQTQYPDKIITSGTYSYSCTGPQRNSTFRPYQPASPSKKARPVFFISTPYADAEFISHAMKENNLPMPYEYLGRATATWLKFHKNFQVSRFYNEVERIFSQDDNLYALLQTDVLSSLFNNTNFSIKRFIKFLLKNEAKVVLVNRKDHFAQAVMASVLHNTPERSVWTKKNKAKINATIDSGTVARTLSHKQNLAEDESLLDEIANSGIEHIRIQMEDFIDNQAKYISEIANLIEKNTLSSITPQDYEAGLQEIHGLSKDGNIVRRYMIDSLGL